MMPFPRWLYRGGKQSEGNSGDRNLQAISKKLRNRSHPIMHVKMWFAQKKLLREIEYLAYLALDDSGQHMYWRDAVLSRWRQRFLSGLVIFVAFHGMGVLLNTVPMRHPSSVEGLHFMVAGALITWFLWSWPNIRLSCFLARVERYARKSIERELDIS